MSWSDDLLAGSLATSALVIAVGVHALIPRAVAAGSMAAITFACDTGSVVSVKWEHFGTT